VFGTLGLDGPSNSKTEIFEVEETGMASNHFARSRPSVEGGLDSLALHRADEQVTYIYMYDGRSTNPIIHEFTSGIIFIAKSYQIYMGRIHRKKAPPPLFSAGSIQCCQERYLPAPIPTTG
jgi:hypothetical protein